MNYDDAIFSPDQAYRYALSRRILDPLDSTPSERREEARKRMQETFDRTVESLKQCAAVYRAHNKTEE